MAQINVNRAGRIEVNVDPMQSAIQDVLDQNFSIRKSALKHNVRLSRLTRRLQMFPPNQVFTNEEEARLYEYLTHCSNMQNGLLISQVRKLAYEFAKLNEFRYPLSWDNYKLTGKEWAKHFSHRHSLFLREPRNIRSVECFDPVLKKFYENLEMVLKKYNFTADRIYNYDGYVISPTKNACKKLPENDEELTGEPMSAEKEDIVTFGGIIAANGTTIPPLLIFPEGQFQDHFMIGAPEGSLACVTQNGWFDSSIFLEVLKHIQNQTLCNKDNPILLLVVNYEWHITMEAVDFARDHGIVYLAFPRHTRYRLQPLDVGVFRPFRVHLKMAYKNWRKDTGGSTLNISDIPELVTTAYYASFNCSKITNAFMKSGIWPFNNVI